MTFVDYSASQSSTLNDPPLERQSLYPTTSTIEEDTEELVNQMVETVLTDQDPQMKLT